MIIKYNNYLCNIKKTFNEIQLYICNSVIIYILDHKFQDHISISFSFKYKLNYFVYISFEYNINRKYGILSYSSNFLKNFTKTIETKFGDITESYYSPYKNKYYDTYYIKCSNLLIRFNMLAIGSIYKQLNDNQI